MQFVAQDYIELTIMAGTRSFFFLGDESQELDPVLVNDLKSLSAMPTDLLSKFADMFYQFLERPSVRQF